LDKYKRTAEEIILDVMQHHGFRRNYEVADYFGVTPQTLSGWVKTNAIPPKHYMKYEKEILSDLTHETEKNAIYVNLPQSSNDNISVQKSVSSIVFFKSILKKNKYLFLLTVFTAALLSIGYLFLATPVYTSVTKILPISEDNNTLAGFSGVAAQIGFSVPAGIGPSTPWNELYPEIVQSENLMNNLVNKTLSTEKYGPNKFLLDILSEEGGYSHEDDFIKTKSAIEVLQKMISVEKYRMSPLVTLKVNSFEPQLVQDLADSILGISGELLRNLKTRQIKAKRLFIEERLAEVLNEKDIMQEQFRNFLEKNRGLDSPSLLIREKEMASQLELQNSLYLTLKTQYEEAKIEEVAKTPMIQIIDGPIKPAKMTSPKPMITLFLVIFISFSLMFMIVYLRESSIQNHSTG